MEREIIHYQKKQLDLLEKIMRQLKTISSQLSLEEIKQPEKNAATDAATEDLLLEQGAQNKTTEDTQL